MGIRFLFISTCTGELLNSFDVDNSDSSGYIADLSTKPDATYDLFMQVEYQDSNKSLCVDIGTYQLDTIANPPTLAIDTQSNKDFTPSYTVGGIEGDADWYLYSGACSDTSLLMTKTLAVRFLVAMQVLILWVI